MQLLRAPNSSRHVSLGGISQLELSQGKSSCQRQRRNLQSYFFKKNKIQFSLESCAIFRFFQKLTAVIFWLNAELLVKFETEWTHVVRSSLDWLMKINQVSSCNHRILSERTIITDRLRNSISKRIEASKKETSIIVQWPSFVFLRKLKQSKRIIITWLPIQLQSTLDIITKSLGNLGLNFLYYFCHREKILNFIINSSNR